MFTLAVPLNCMQNIGKHANVANGYAGGPMDYGNEDDEDEGGEDEQYDMDKHISSLTEDQQEERLQNDIYKILNQGEGYKDLKKLSSSSSEISVDEELMIKEEDEMVKDEESEI